MADSPERIPWAEMERILRGSWRPGDHFSVVAPTGYGKSHLIMRGLLPRWTHVLTLDVKGDDPIVRRYGGQRVRGFPTQMEQLASELSDRNPRRLYRVAPGSLGRKGRGAFYDAIDGAWRSASRRRSPGSWVVNVDEARIMSDHLGMRDHLIQLWVLGRSKGLTIIAGTQAPRYVPSEFYDQASWVAIGKARDERTLRRLSEISGAVGDAVDVRKILPTLERSEHRREFLIVGPDEFHAITSWERGKR